MTALESARARAVERAAFMERVRAALRDMLRESWAYDPFDHGTFLYQLRHEINSLLAEGGDQLTVERRRRRNSRSKIGPAMRAAVFRRDEHTCQRCGFRSSPEREERIRQNRSGWFLTLDHIVPLCEGGKTVKANLQTLCSHCNPAKGKALPDDPPPA